MPESRLRQTLEELERELESHGDAVDPRSRELIDHAVRDVREVLERAGDDAGEPDHPTLLDRLGEATRHFEESHPTLAETIGRVANALSNMGI